MKAVKKMIFAFSVMTALTVGISAQSPWDMQDKNPPEKVKEQPKPDDKSKNDRQGNDRKDDKKEDKKKP
ncbi:MAG: hypothetical protein ACKVZH_20095 [Blastocatellia bacterium]